MEWLKAVPVLSDLLLVESSGMTFLDALPILKNGLLACLLVAAVCAFLGVYVILRRIVFVSAALTQASSLGIAVAFLMAAIVGHPTLPGLASVLFAAVAAGLLAIQTRERKITRESLLGIGYVFPGALVLLILDRITGETHAIENILFGNTVFVSTSMLVWLFMVAVVVLFIHLLFYKEFVFVAFDPDTARAVGIRVGLYNQIFFLSLALMISISISAVGALPVFGFMVMPAASALLLTDRLKSAFLLSVLFGCASALAGFYLSFLYDLPTGPAMLAVCGFWLAPALVLTAFRRFGISGSS